MVLLHIFQGGVQLFPGRGVQLPISIETHITITCDFPGGLEPISPSGSAHFGTNRLRRACAASLGLETSNANWSIVFKRLAKTLIKLRICTDWSKPLVLAHTTLLEISYCGPFIGAKKCITAVYQDDIAFVS